MIQKCEYIFLRKLYLRFQKGRVMGAASVVERKYTDRIGVEFTTSFREDKHFRFRSNILK